mmetsp:Transcript_30683/g.51020  ORF Transcript_30683/g.51020 Transcript_30683/m.51020 type:complete len:203 (-) Transcript_30683:3-611(-)
MQAPKTVSSNGLLASGVKSSSTFCCCSSSSAAPPSLPSAAAGASWNSSFFSSTISGCSGGSSVLGFGMTFSSSGSRATIVISSGALSISTASATLRGQGSPLIASTCCPTAKSVPANLLSSLMLEIKTFPGSAVVLLKEIPSLGGFLNRLGLSFFTVAIAPLQTSEISSPPGAFRRASAASLGDIPSISCPAALTTTRPGTN